VPDHFVFDGSNLATEGRTEPSLAQLQEAVAAFLTEHPGAVTTVVVDASFEHRIDPSERAAFAKTESAGEVFSPPAGAVGRGDGFLLQIADRTRATVVSNDSFQEFHAEYEWLFEPGRLIGGKPVPGVGWIFSLRRPVRGIVSRKTVQKAKQGDREAKQADRASKQVRQAIAEATASALEPDAPKRRRRRGGRGRSSAKTESATEPEAVNAPASFLRFVIDHRLGTEVEGTVDAFASHGAFVVVDGARCYVPLSAMGNPPPSRARDVLKRGETRAFVVQAVDAPRRGIELGLPGFATVAGAPSEETVAAEVGTRRSGRAKKGSTRPAARPAAKPADLQPARPAKKPKKQAQSPTPAKKQAVPAKQANKGSRAKKAEAEPSRKQQPAPAKKGKKTAGQPRKQQAAEQRAKQVPPPGKATKKAAKQATTKAAKKVAKKAGKRAASSAADAPAKKQAPGKKQAPAARVRSGS